MDVLNGKSHRTTSAHGFNALCKKNSGLRCESSKIVFVGKRHVLCDVLQLRFSYHLRKTHHIVLTQHLARFFRDFHWRRRAAQRGFVENQQHFLSVTVMSHVCAGSYSAHVNTRIARAQRTCRSVRIRLTINFRFVSLFFTTNWPDPTRINSPTLTPWFKFVRFVGSNIPVWEEPRRYATYGPSVCFTCFRQKKFGDMWFELGLYLRSRDLVGIRQLPKTRSGNDSETMNKEERCGQSLFQISSNSCKQRHVCIDVS